MRILVCGGLDYDNWDLLAAVLDELMRRERIIEVITGGGPGAATLARLWCRLNAVAWSGHSADWKLQGREAGPIRNGEMLELKPNIVVAFPGGIDTADMVSKVKAATLPLIEVEA